MCIVISYIIFLTFLTQPPSRAPSFRRRGVASPRGPGEESGKEPVRFDSFRFRNWFVLIRFGSVRFGNRFGRFDAVRPALFERLVVGSGFGSVRLCVRFRPVPKSNGSVRFGRIGIFICRFYVCSGCLFFI